MPRQDANHFFILGMVPNIIDLVALYLITMEPLHKHMNQIFIDDLKMYLDNSILLENHRNERCKDKISTY